MNEVVARKPVVIEQEHCLRCGNCFRGLPCKGGGKEMTPA